MRLVQVLENDTVARIQVLDELLHGNVAMGRVGKGRERGVRGKGGEELISVSQASRHIN